MKLRLISALALAVACAHPSTRPQAAPAPVHPFDASAPLTDVQRHWVDSTLASLTLHDRVGQMVMVWVLGDYTSNGDSSFAEVRRWIQQDHIGGVSMSLGTPIEVAAKINAMQRISLVPLLASSDLEPGLGRLEGGLFSHYLMDAGSATIFPSNMAIAATGRDEDAHDVAHAIGEEARAVGIQIDFAPVVDVNNNPSNPVINTRSFGEDPARVARLSALFVRGLAETGTAATAKHFPGHGDTDVDSHVGLPIVGATMARLDSVELVPFRAATRAGAGLVMTAHIALPAVAGDSTTPATLSPRIITGLLRDSLGFRGVTITDAMTMEGVGKGYTTEQSSVLAVQAGSDILLKPTDPTRAIDAIVAAVGRGEISRQRIDSAARHVLELKARLAVNVNRYADLEALRDVVGSPAHRALAADVAQRAITLLRDHDNVVPLRGQRALIVQYAPETELKAGRVFAPVLTSALAGSRAVKIQPNVSKSQLDSIAALGQGMDRIVVATYVRRIEGEGRFAMPPHIAAWIDSLAKQTTGPKVVVAAFGNPYIIRQFPSVGSYMVTYGVSDDLERGAARALLGLAPITGRAPISLPGFFRAGDGLGR
ncbi:MAG TPA: glycoside hydrolase family 3 N-terminal domain-containing protein [Gemmatimonadaceae bacterium]|jgi:beta-N-acetylhexosaminidase